MLVRWVLISMTGKKRWGCQVDKKTAEIYKQYFRENDIYFEPSEAYDLVHISFMVTDEEMDKLTKWVKTNPFARGGSHE